MTSLFVTSSGTGIGKTHVAAALLSALPPGLKVRCIKPIVTGFDSEAGHAEMAASDPGRLIAAQGRAVSPDSIAATSPWHFRAALSVDMAAARESRSVPFGELVAFSQAPADVDLNIVEGLGGVMAPIDDRHTVLDWIAALDTATLLVVGSYLGTLSHTLTALEALRLRERAPVAIVVSQSVDEPVPLEETIATLARLARGTPVVAVPRSRPGDDGPEPGADRANEPGADHANEPSAGIAALVRRIGDLSG